jgi:hypothetical protein
MLSLVCFIVMLTVIIMSVMCFIAMLTITMLIVVLQIIVYFIARLNVFNAEFVVFYCYADCCVFYCYADRHSANCRSAKCRVVSCTSQISLKREVHLPSGNFVLG